MRNRRPRRRRVLVAVAAVAGAVGVVGLALRDSSPVGHFTSAAAKDRFVTAYDRAMADLPSPQRTLDVRTSFGVVRVYRFAGAQPTKAPLVLLPGRASASPVWADNLPALLKLCSVYAIDLLGEPGLSIQDRPITSDADQAQWLHEALLQLPEPRIHLVGLSIGGWTTANLLVNQPSKVISATLLDPVYVFSDLSLEAILRSIPATVRWFPKAWRDDFASWTAGGAPVKDVPVAQMIEAGMQPTHSTCPRPAGSRRTESRPSASRSWSSWPADPPCTTPLPQQTSRAAVSSMGRFASIPEPPTQSMASTPTRSQQTSRPSSLQPSRPRVDARYGGCTQ